MKSFFDVSHLDTTSVLIMLYYITFGVGHKFNIEQIRYILLPIVAVTLVYVLCLWIKSRPKALTKLTYRFILQSVTCTGLILLTIFWT